MSAPLWSLDAIAAAMGAERAGAWPREVPGLSIDTRTIKPGEAFFAIQGENRDGQLGLRELRNAVERAAILASEELVAPGNLPAQVIRGDRAAAPSLDSMTLDQVEAEHIRRILGSTNTIEDAATTLGIDPSTLYRKRKRYGI